MRRVQGNRYVKREVCGVLWCATLDMAVLGVHGDEVLMPMALMVFVC